MQSIYLDNAATSFPKPAGVSDSMKQYLDCVGATINRSVYGRAQEAGLETLALREVLARLFHFPEPATHVVLTPGATFGLNLVIKGLLRPGDHCIVSGMEHNAVMRPLQQLGGVEFDRIPCDSEGFLQHGALEGLFRPNTRLVVLAHASNVCGSVQDAAAVGAACARHGMLFPAGRRADGRTLSIDFAALRLSALAVPGHKGLLGPSGIGALLLTDELAASLTPLVAGGTGSASDSELLPPYLPDRLESGTPNLPGIYGLRAALAFVEQQGVERLRRHELALCEALSGRHRAAFRRPPVRHAGARPPRGRHLRGPAGPGQRRGGVPAGAGVRHPDALRSALRPCGAPFPRDVPAGDHPLLARLCEYRAGRRRRRCGPAGDQRRLILGPPL